jgi:predicted kinase
VVDATNVTAAAKARMRQWAQRYGRPATALRFVVEDDVLLHRNATRTEHARVADDDVLRYAHLMRVEATPAQLRAEGFDVVEVVWPPTNDK